MTYKDVYSLQNLYLRLSFDELKWKILPFCLVFNFRTHFFLFKESKLFRYHLDH